MRDGGPDLTNGERFERVWRKYGASIVRYCQFTSGSPGDGEDLAADTFVRFLQKGAQIPDERVEAWLFTVAHNLCMSYHRRQKRWAAALPLIAALTRWTEQPADGQDLPLMLGGLDELGRLAVYLRVVEDRPYADVARVLGTSEEAARKRVSRALARLRSCLDPPGEYDPSSVQEV